MILDFLIKPVTGLVSDVLKRVLPPEKMSESERANLEQQISMEIMKQDWKGIELQMQDLVSARVLAEKELEGGNPFTKMLAAIHRPLWSLVCLAIFTWTLVSKQAGLPEIVITPAHEGIMQLVITFYFGGRTIEKVTDMVKNGKNK